MSFDIVQVWTPGEISAYITNLSNAWDLLDSDITAAGTYPAAKTKAFKIALASFRSWRDSITFLAKLTLSPVRTADQFATQLAYWRDDFQKTTGKPATGAAVPVPTTGDEAALLSKALTLATVGIGAYVLVNVLSTARAFRR